MSVAAEAQAEPVRGAGSGGLRIYMDISTTWAAQNRRVAGILRAEIEYASRLLARPEEEARFVIYVAERNCFVEPGRELVKTLIGKVSGVPWAARGLGISEQRRSGGPGAQLYALAGLARHGGRLLWVRRRAPPDSERARDALARVRHWIARHRNELRDPRVGRLLGSRAMRLIFGGTRVDSLSALLAAAAAPPAPPALPGESALRDLPKARFQGPCVFITLGAGWGRVEFFREIERLKREAGASVISMVHDTIPVKFPTSMRNGVLEQFVLALYRMTWLSDLVICNSRSTERDFKALARELALPERATEVITLGCSVPGDPGETLEASHFPELDGRRFVLFVGSIEPRKNHALTYQLWRRLAVEHPDSAAPLVWVGGDAWDTGDLLQRVARDPFVTPRFIIRYKDCSDQELRWLYENCLFTIYPSDYEGWGLPIVESLRFGKHCVTGTGSSLEEASQGLAAHIDPLDGLGWLAEVRRCLEDPAYLRRREKEIARAFRPTDWETAADRLFDKVARRADAERRRKLKKRGG